MVGNASGVRELGYTIKGKCFSVQQLLGVHMKSRRDFSPLAFIPAGARLRLEVVPEDAFSPLEKNLYRCLVRNPLLSPSEVGGYPVKLFPFSIGSQLLDAISI